MSINDELTVIEAIMNESEKEIKTGTISAEAIVRSIDKIADPNVQFAKTGEWIAMLKGKINKINIMRLKELKHQHPNDLRIRQLGRRAAECFLTLHEVGLSASEMLVSPDFKPGVRAQNQQIMNGLKMMFADLLQ